MNFSSRITCHQDASVFFAVAEKRKFVYSKNQPGLFVIKHKTAIQSEKKYDGCSFSTSQCVLYTAHIRQGKLHFLQYFLCSCEIVYARFEDFLTLLYDFSGAFKFSFTKNYR